MPQRCKNRDVIIFNSFRNLRGIKYRNSLKIVKCFLNIKLWTKWNWWLFITNVCPITGYIFSLIQFYKNSKHSCFTSISKKNLFKKTINLSFSLFMSEIADKHPLWNIIRATCTFIVRGLSIRISTDSNTRSKSTSFTNRRTSASSVNHDRRPTRKYNHAFPSVSPPIARRIVNAIDRRRKVQRATEHKREWRSRSVPARGRGCFIRLLQNENAPSKRNTSGIMLRKAAYTL